MKKLFTASEKAQALAEYVIIFSVFIAVLIGVYSLTGPTLKDVVGDMTEQFGVTIINNGDSNIIMSVDDNDTCDGAMDDDCTKDDKDKDDKDDKCTGQTKDKNGNDHNDDGHTDCGDNGNGQDNDKKKDKDK